jgi:hypothetical protein
LLERVEKAKNHTRDFDPDKHLYTVKREAKRIIFPNHDYERAAAKQEVAKPEELKVVHKEPVPLEPEPVELEAQPKKTQKSFFDEIG